MSNSNLNQMTSTILNFEHFLLFENIFLVGLYFFGSFKCRIRVAYDINCICSRLYDTDKRGNIYI